jgi:hypothetical protein
MKKLTIITLLLILGFSQLSAQNYERSFGLRAGTMIGASYKQFFRPVSPSAFEAVLDMDMIRLKEMSLRGSIFYEYHFRIQSVDGLSWYLGPGLTIGAKVGNNSAFLFAVDVIGGVEYKLSRAPISFSLDGNPKLFLTGYGNATFKPANVGLTARYTF